MRMRKDLLMDRSPGVGGGGKEGEDEWKGRGKRLNRNDLVMGRS